MGILEDLLAAIIANTAAQGGAAAPDAKAEAKPAAKPAAKAADKGPSLEDVQNKIRGLVAADEGNAPKIKAATASLGGKRAGDFEGDAVKLKKLMALLDAMGEDDAPAADEDDDLL